MATITNSPYTDDVANFSQGKLQSSNLFLASAKKPQWKDHLLRKYKKFTLAYLLNKIGKVSYTSNKTYNWSEMGRTRTSQTIASHALVGGGATANITASTTTQYFIEKDVIILDSGKLAFVNSVTIGGSQVINVSPVDGVDFVAGDFGDDDVGQMGHLGNMHEECFTIPASRTFIPDFYENGFTKLVSNKSYCDDALAEPVWYKASNGQHYHYYVEQMIQTEEHVRDTELAILVGQRANGSTVPTGATMAKGILPFVISGGVKSTIAAAPTEDDIIDHAAAMTVNADTENFLVLCGNDYMTGATKAMKVYHQDGSQLYGDFGGKANDVGLKFQNYIFNGCKFSFVNYNVFNDPASLGVVSSPDYKNTALFLSMDKNSKGEDLIEVMYQQGITGRKYNMFYSYAGGHLDHPKYGESDGQRSIEQACFSETYSTNVSVCVRGLNSHGIQQG